MTPEALETEAANLCPHCALGRKLRWREDTKEWTHDWVLGKNSFSHTLCGASDLRKANANG